MEHGFNLGFTEVEIICEYGLIGANSNILDL
jgi:hypothetical protein